MTAPTGVQATRTAVEQVGAAVQSFVRLAKQAGEQATMSAMQLERRAGDEHARRVGEVRRAKATKEAAASALRGCTENCAPLQQALAHAESAEALAVKRAHASAKAVAQVGEAIQDFAGGRRSFESALEEHGPRIRSSVEQLSSRLEQYLGSANEPATAPSSGGATSLGEASPGARSLEDVGVGDIIDDRSSSLTFEKVSRDQVAWGLDRLKAVVEPALKRGKGPDYFAARDAAEGLSGERSYSGVHNWFYNPDHAVKLTRASGGYVVENGHHRLAVAREMGIDALPAVVR